MKTKIGPAPSWEPAFALDLALASNQKFQDLVEDFEKLIASKGQLPPLELKNGWLTVTPQIAEQLLFRNLPGANRKASLSTSIYYAVQMQNGQWPRTGQPIILTVDGVLVDGQQRAWASYLGRVSFETFLVTDTPSTEDLFAYIDNGRSRNGATALETAGLNGMSSLMTQAILIAFNFESGLYTCHKKKRGVRIAPIQVLYYAKEHPEIKTAARYTAAEYKDAYNRIGHKDITAFVVYKLLTLHNEEVCDRFMEDIGDPSELADDSPVRALVSFLDKQAKAKDPVAKHIVPVAHIIKAFNAWINGEKLKKVVVPQDDPFPDFVEGGVEMETDTTETEPDLQTAETA